MSEEFASSPTISWGDGSQSTGTIQNVGDGIYAVNGDHTYTGGGFYTVGITLNTLSNSSASSSHGRAIQPGPTNTQVITPTMIYHINDSGAVGGQGHSAVIIPNGNGCTYYSYAMDGKVTVVNYNNITDALAAAKAAGYTRDEYWNITAAQAADARAAARAFNGTTYDVSTHNCWHMVLSALEAANENVFDAGADPNINFNDNENGYALGWSNLP